MIFSRLRDRRFCAFCKASRTIYLKKHIDVTNVVGALVFALVGGFVSWGQPDLRAVIFFGAGLVLAEVFVYMRWRASIVCTMCGFDPIIYKRSPEKAAATVRSFFNERMDDPEFILSKSPLLELRRKLRAQQRKKDAYQEFLSRSSSGHRRVPVIDPR